MAYSWFFDSPIFKTTENWKRGITMSQKHNWSIADKRTFLKGLQAEQN